MKKILFILLLLPVVTTFAQNKVEKWHIFELTLKGTSKGNPFTEIQVSAEFTNSNHRKTIDGFYDGNGIYKIRFMPQETGTWNMTITPLEGEFSGRSLVVLPQKPFTALRVTKINNE